MSPEQKAAYVNSQAACAMIEAMGMHADNQSAVYNKVPPPWIKSDFDQLQVKYGIHHNAVHDYTHR